MPKQAQSLRWTCPASDSQLVASDGMEPQSAQYVRLLLQVLHPSGSPGSPRLLQVPQNHPRQSPCGLLSGTTRLPRHLGCPGSSPGLYVPGSFPFSPTEPLLVPGTEPSPGRSTQKPQEP